MIIFLIRISALLSQQLVVHNFLISDNILDQSFAFSQPPQCLNDIQQTRPPIESPFPDCPTVPRRVCQQPLVCSAVAELKSPPCGGYVGQDTSCKDSDGGTDSEKDLHPNPSATLWRDES